MELRVKFTACCTWPDVVRAARRVLSVIVVVVIVLVLDGRLLLDTLVR
ncbi:hypothetical protein OG205_15255 [Lentzea sp. NBC_00516]|nr:hypothetical protein [Lentzea sp. NBC_00516]WUD28304.1 hypothetical protein OG205_15255 [Lentzea sp. NBC_00516]